VTLVDFTFELDNKSALSIQFLSLNITKNC